MKELNERELLALLCHFIQTKQLILGDNESIRDMVKRYKQPPFTLLFPVAMQMTVKDVDDLNRILKQAYKLLNIPESENAPTP